MSLVLTRVATESISRTVCVDGEDSQTESDSLDVNQSRPEYASIDRVPQRYRSIPKDGPAR